MNSLTSFPIRPSEERLLREMKASRERFKKNLKTKFKYCSDPMVKSLLHLLILAADWANLTRCIRTDSRFWFFNKQSIKMDLEEVARTTHELRLKMFMKEERCELRKELTITIPIINRLTTAVPESTMTEVVNHLDLLLGNSNSKACQDIRNMLDLQFIILGHIDPAQYDEDLITAAKQLRRLVRIYNRIRSRDSVKNVRLVST